MREIQHAYLRKHGNLKLHAFHNAINGIKSINKNFYASICLTFNLIKMRCFIKNIRQMWDRLGRKIIEVIFNCLFRMLLKQRPSTKLFPIGIIVYRRTWCFLQRRYIVSYESFINT